jgi:hypothetical protein
MRANSWPVEEPAFQKSPGAMALVGLMTRPRVVLSGTGIPAGGKRFFYSLNVKTGSEVHAASRSKLPGFFARRYSGRIIRLTAHHPYFQSQGVDLLVYLHSPYMPS